MPFGLKNAGATYQRAMVTLFHDMMHKEIEVYVDDMIAKSGEGENHVQVLRKLFERLRKYKLRLNPAKCSFGVKSGKLLGFVTEREVRGFLGRLNYIARFISQLTTTCDPIFRLLRKKNPGIWNTECEEAFEKIKQYLLKPPLLVPPVPKRPLILYLTVTGTAMGCVLGQQDESGRKERAIYYLSKKFMECESRYTMIEKLCCALAWAAKRLRQYMLYHTTWLISRLDPLKYICEKPYLSSRIARWQVLLSEYDIVYMTRKAVKGSVIADHLADHAMDDYEPLDFDFPDEDVFSVEEGKLGWWTMYFDGAVNVCGNGAGAVIISPDKKQYPVSTKLQFGCTNNTAEYEACILGLETALELNVKKIDVYGDSMLIIYFGQNLQPIHIDIRNNPAHCCSVEGEIDGNPWYYDIKNFIQNQAYPMGASNIEKKTLRRLAMDFYLDGEVLYKRSSDGTLLRCLDGDWHEMLPFALHAYRTAVRTSTGATPYMLVYGMEAVMPLEVEIPSLRVLIDSELDEAEWAKVRYEQLNLISEKRLAAICHHQLYQRRMARSYDKKVRPRKFQEGDLVLKKILFVPGQDQSKWAPNYEGPYVVKKSFSGGALLLSRMDGEDLVRPVNSDSVKKYYA
ncbi:Integrase, catalytic core [Salix suchowensis]|nr:Integrase, catalytic core [Salix suchowensis]